MAHETGIDIVQAGQSLVDGVRKTGGPSGQPFLYDQIIIPQLFLQQAGPALLLIIAAVIRSAVAVGVGIAEAYNMSFFHQRAS